MQSQTSLSWQLLCCSAITPRAAFLPFHKNLQTHFFSFGQLVIIRYLPISDVPCFLGPPSFKTCLGHLLNFYSYQLF